MRRNSKHDMSNLTRRRLLRYAGSVGIAAGIAGCSGQPPEPGNEGSSNVSGESGRIDTSFLMYANSLAGEAQFNMYNPSNQHMASSLTYLPLAAYNPAKVKFFKVLASDWEISQDTATITLREQTWDTGDALTADDLLTTLRLEKQFNHPLWSFVDEVQKTGKRSIKFSPAQANPEAFQAQLLPLQVRAPRFIYDEYLQKIQDATTESEQKSVQKELVSFTIQEPPSLGPFTYDSRQSDRLVFNIRDEGHPHLDKINFTGIIYQTMEAQKALASIYERRVDWFHGLVTKKTVNQFPDHITYTRNPVFNGMALELNFRNDLLTRPEIRKAMAMVLDRKTITANCSPLFYTAIPRISGIAGTITNLDKKWLGDAYSKFDVYGYKQSKTDAASSLLKDQGYSKNNKGKWMLPDGSKMKQLTLMGPSGWSWARGAQTIASQLNDFGFDIKFQAQAAGVLYGSTYPNGNFDLVTGYWGSGIPYPGRNIQTMFNASGTVATAGNPSQIPTTFEVPPLDDPSGEPIEVDVEEIFNKLAKASPEEAPQYIKLAAWVVNQAIPKVQIMEKTDVATLNVGDWTFPIDSKKKIMSMPVWDVYSFDHGIVKAKHESPT